MIFSLFKLLSLLHLTTALKLIIPLFETPELQDHWCVGSWARVAESSVSKDIIAVVSPFNSTLSHYNQAEAYNTCLDYLVYNQVKVLGYLDTKTHSSNWQSVGFRSYNDLKADVDLIANTYPQISGFYEDFTSPYNATFWDPNIEDHVNYYKEISGIIHSIPRDMYIIISSSIPPPLELFYVDETGYAANAGIIFHGSQQEWDPSFNGQECSDIVASSANQTFVPGPFCRYEPNLELEEIRNFIFTKKVTGGAFVLSADQHGSTVSQIIDTALKEGLELVYVSNQAKLDTLANEAVFSALEERLRTGCDNDLMRFDGESCVCTDPNMVTYDGATCVCKDTNSQIKDSTCQCYSTDMIMDPNGLCHCGNGYRLIDFQCVEDNDTYFCEHNACKVLLSSTTLGITSVVLYILLINCLDRENPMYKSSMMEKIEVRSRARKGTLQIPDTSIDIEFRIWTSEEHYYTCTLCKGAFNDDSQVAEAPCKHLFHAACMRQLLSDRNSESLKCPQCGANLK